jgi:hypothetical protein
MKYLLSRVAFALLALPVPGGRSILASRLKCAWCAKPAHSRRPNDHLHAQGTDADSGPSLVADAAALDRPLE